MGSLAVPPDAAVWWCVRDDYIFGYMLREDSHVAMVFKAQDPGVPIDVVEVSLGVHKSGEAQVGVRCDTEVRMCAVRHVRLPHSPIPTVACARYEGIP